MSTAQSSVLHRRIPILSADLIGWDNNRFGLLLPGDYFEVNGELKMVTANVDSDGGPGHDR